MSLTAAGDGRPRKDQTACNQLPQLARRTEEGVGGNLHPIGLGQWLCHRSFPATVWSGLIGHQLIVRASPAAA
jgi:hypothetical protein